MKIFSDYLFDDFLTKVIAMIEADFPAFFGNTSAAERREYALHATQEARKWDILSAADIEEFSRICVYLKVDLGSEHVEWGSAEAILSNPSLTPAIKLGNIGEMLQELDRELNGKVQAHAKT